MFIENAILIGHSLGGHISLQASLELSLKGLVIFGTPPLDNPMSEASFLDHEYGHTFLTKNLTDDEFGGWSEACFSKNYKAPSIKEKVLRKADPRVRESLKESVFDREYESELSILKELSYPICIIHGEEDSFINLKYIESLDIPTLWNNKIQVIKGVGHYPHIENIKIFEGILFSYIEDIFN